MENFKLTKEIKNLAEAVKQLDKKIVIIFLAVAVLQTISWYYTSRRFFRINIFEYYQSNKHVYLIEYLYWFIGDFFTLLIIPVLIIKFWFKEKPKNYGLQIGDYKAGFGLSAIFLAVMVLIIWFASASGSFSEAYPQYAGAKESWRVFIIFEAGMMLYLFAWEFIWRGFMLFGLEEKFGYYAVLIQMIPFLILHNGKPAAETFGAIAGGIALGILALRTRSVYYCVITHAGVMFSIDFISTLRYRAGEFGVGFTSLLNLIKALF